MSHAQRPRGDRPARRSARRTILALLLLWPTMGMGGGLGLPFCPDNQLDPSSGNLHRITDLVVVRPGGEDVLPAERGFVVLAAPEIEQLRVYDTLDRDFLRGPNVYFPLSIRTGPATRRLAKAPGDDSRVYALDAADDRIRVVRTRSQGEALSFTKVGTGASTGRAPGDIAVVNAADSFAISFAFVTLPDEGIVEVIEIDKNTGSGSTVARVDLGPGSHPADIAVDPSGDAVVVTDAALDSVAIIRTDTFALDRRIDVGGPTLGIAVGRVDPGDGMGPVALVAHRDAPLVSAIRLYRPAVREDRYALLGTVELPDLVEAVYIPDQRLPGAGTEPTVCCPRVEIAAEATLAWAAAVTISGELFYLRLDGRRTGEFLGYRGMLRLVDNDPETPGYDGRQTGLDPNTASDVWFPVGDSTGRPAVRFRSVDNYGQPPVVPWFEEGAVLSLVWQGSPPGGRNRVVEHENGRLLFRSDGSGRPLSTRDVRPGDALVALVANRPSPACPDEGVIIKTIVSLAGDSVDVGELTLDELSCLENDGPFRANVLVADAFTADVNSIGYLGRLRFEDPDDEEAPETEVSIPGISVRIEDNGSTIEAGSALILPLDQHITPIAISFSQIPLETNNFTGFGRFGLLPTSMAGGEMLLQPLNSDEDARLVRRMFVGISSSSEFENGRLIELNETETVLTFVNADDQ